MAKTGVVAGSELKRAVVLRLSDNIDGRDELALLWFAVVVQSIEDLVSLMKIIEKNKGKNTRIYANFVGKYWRVHEFERERNALINWFYSADCDQVCQWCGLDVEYVIDTMRVVNLLPQPDALAA